MVPTLWVLRFAYRSGVSGPDYSEIAIRGVGFYMHLGVVFYNRVCGSVGLFRSFPVQAHKT